MTAHPAQSPEDDSRHEDGEPDAPLSLRDQLNVTIFGVETPAGRHFDIALLVVIVLSIVVVMLESVNDIADSYKLAFRIIEWAFTIVFTVE